MYPLYMTCKYVKVLNLNALGVEEVVIFQNSEVKNFHSVNKNFPVLRLGTPLKYVWSFIFHLYNLLLFRRKLLASSVIEDFKMFIVKRKLHFYFMHLLLYYFSALLLFLAQGMHEPLHPS